MNKRKIKLVILTITLTFYSCFQYPTNFKINTKNGEIITISIDELKKAFLEANIEYDQIKQNQKTSIHDIFSIKNLKNQIILFLEGTVFLGALTYALTKAIKKTKTYFDATIEINKKVIDFENKRDLKYVFDDKLATDIILKEVLNNINESQDGQRRILFHGASGLGKTHFVLKICSQHGYIYYPVNEIYNNLADKVGYIGALKEIFYYAMKYALNNPNKTLVLFFDEVDLFIKHIFTFQSALMLFLSDEHPLKTIQNIIIIGATNNYDELEPRMKDRFIQQYVVESSETKVKNILEKHLVDKFNEEIAQNGFNLLKTIYNNIQETEESLDRCTSQINYTYRHSDDLSKQERIQLVIFRNLANNYNARIDKIKKHYFFNNSTVIGLRPRQINNIVLELPRNPEANDKSTLDKLSKIIYRTIEFSDHENIEKFIEETSHAVESIKSNQKKNNDEKNT